MLILSSVAKLLGAAILFPNNSKNDEGTLNTLMNVANKLIFTCNKNFKNL